MDEKEVPEGMKWGELAKIVKDKVQVKVEVKAEVGNNSEGYVNTPCALRSALSDNVVTWLDLILALMEERSFFSLQKEPGKGMSAMKVPTSKKVLDCFFERAWDKPIFKSKNN
jgi:hypothetical protein